MREKEWKEEAEEKPERARVRFCFKDLFGGVAALACSNGEGMGQWVCWSGDCGFKPASSKWWP